MLRPCAPGHATCARCGFTQRCAPNVAPMCKPSFVGRMSVGGDWSGDSPRLAAEAVGGPARLVLHSRCEAGPKSIARLSEIRFDVVESVDKLANFTPNWSDLQQGRPNLLRLVEIAQNWPMSPKFCRARTLFRKRPRIGTHQPDQLISRFNRRPRSSNPTAQPPQWWMLGTGRDGTFGQVPARLHAVWAALFACPAEVLPVYGGEVVVTKALPPRLRPNVVLIEGSSRPAPWVRLRLPASCNEGGDGDGVADLGRTPSARAGAATEAPGVPFGGARGWQEVRGRMQIAVPAICKQTRLHVHVNQAWTCRTSEHRMSFGSALWAAAVPSPELVARCRLSARKRHGAASESPPALLPRATACREHGATSACSEQDGRASCCSNSLFVDWSRVIALAAFHSRHEVLRSEAAHVPCPHPFSALHLPSSSHAGLQFSIGLPLGRGRIPPCRPHGRWFDRPATHRPLNQPRIRRIVKMLRAAAIGTKTVPRLLFRAPHGVPRERAGGGRIGAQGPAAVCLRAHRPSEGARAPTASNRCDSGCSRARPRPTMLCLLEPGRRGAPPIAEDGVGRLTARAQRGGGPPCLEP